MVNSAKVFCGSIDTIPVSNAFSNQSELYQLGMTGKCLLNSVCENQIDSCKVSYLCLTNFALGCE